MKPSNKHKDLDSALLKTKANIQRQAILALLAITTTVVLCFALTVAWYSNILHTSDLTFKAKTWDFVFEGNLNMQDGNILASPGDNGIITLSLANISDETNMLGTSTDVSAIGVNVNISKSDMGLLSPRIYFYVDKSETLNGETVDKQYLSSVDGFTYTIYPGHTLMISEEYSNDYPIKWEWVYDVVGYYVRGDMSENNQMTNIEYLRPIEYNPDNATFIAKEVSTINGVNVNEWLTNNYLNKDGYPGNTVTQIGDYLQVSADENIYIYLCDKDEIDNYNWFDTALASGENEDTNGYNARIILTGQKANENSVMVSSSEDIVNNINAGYNLLEVQGDMTLSNALIVNGDTDITIDLNGHNLTVEASIDVSEGGSFGIMNGTVLANKENQTLLNVTSSEVYIDNVVLDGFECGIEVYDNKGNEDSHIFISQSEMTTNNSVVWLRGNGNKSDRKTTLIIDNSKLVSKTYIPIGNNGSLQWYGTDIQIISSTLEGLYAGLFLPASQSSTFIKDSTVSGSVGVAIKGGSVIIDNSLIIGNGEYKEPIDNQSGFTETGDAVYIEETYVTRDGREIELVINGKDTTLKSINANALRVYKEDTKGIYVVVNNGKFSSDVSKYLPTDGTKVITQLSDGMWEVNDKPASVTPSETE